MPVSPFAKTQTAYWQHQHYIILNRRVYLFAGIVQKHGQYIGATALFLSLNTNERSLSFIGRFPATVGVLANSKSITKFI